MSSTSTNQGISYLNRAFMNAIDPIVIETLDGKVIDLQRAAVVAYGCAHDELVGQSI